MLKDFYVRGFRTFEDLEIPRLGRVNLIVGRNNVGKTMLLHALRIFQSKGARDVVFDVLRKSEEYSRLPTEHPEDQRVGVYSDEPLDLGALFFGRSPDESSTISLSCSSVAHPQSVRFSVHASLDEGDFVQQSELFDEGHYRRIVRRLGERNVRIYVDDIPSAVFPIDGDNISLSGARRRRVRQPLSRRDMNIAPLLVSGTTETEVLTSWWDSLSLTDAEQDVIRCLRLVSPVERIAFIESSAWNSRIALVKMEGSDSPFPLKALGEGVSRMFAAALALEISKSSGMLLFDEIENGIHYSLLPEFWQFLFKATAKSNVQIFATSHSWDCIEAFQQAAAEDPGAGVLVKLSRRDEKVVSTIFDDEDLKIATRDGIELR